MIAYRAAHPTLTISAFTAFEVLDGLYRKKALGTAEAFLTQTLPALEVIYPDHEIIVISAKINAALSSAGMAIGVIDSLIAATAIARNLTLVTANTKHFSRVQDAGFSFKLKNWRDA